jgi:hypothetical protein
MFDIVDFFKEQTEKWNEQERCNFCYSFGAPLFNSELNVQQTDDCCIQVFLSNISVKSFYTENKNQFYGFKQLEKCVYTFDLYLLKQVPMGQNNYNEIANHPIEESKWENIFKPLLNCFGCGINECNDISNFAGYNNYSVSLVHNYLDNNYNGIKITASIIINANT